MASDISLGCASDKAFINSGTIKGASIDNCVIGATTPVAATFTNLTSTGNTAIGDAITDTVGFYGTAGIAQRASSAQAALTLTTATSAGFGYTTTGAFSAMNAQLEEIRAALVAFGLLKGAA